MRQDITKSIIFGADFVPTQSNANLFINGDINNLFGEKLILLLRESSYRVFNLECPITNRLRPIKKNGPALQATPETLKTYKAIGVNLLTLANNHILDQGAEGLFDTIKLLDQNEINHIGAGTNLFSAAKPHFIRIENKKICFYTCSEHEFSIASMDLPGANPFDSLESFDHVASYSSQCDYLVVLYHGGKEFYRYPSPLLQKTCRKFIDKGARLVIAQHSHCIGCQEKYKQGTIIYGQGNFLFDLANTEYWQTSLLIKLCLEDFSISYIPLQKNGNTVRLATDLKAKDILLDFEKRSNDIKENGFIEKKYAEFALQKIDSYFAIVNGINKRNILFRVLNKVSSCNFQKKLMRHRYTEKKCLSLQNAIECEAHRELLLEGIKQCILNSNK